MLKTTLLSILIAATMFFSVQVSAVEGVLDGMPDPSIIYYEGDFYIFATGEGLPIYRSDDLVNWELIDRVFDDYVPEWAAEAVPGTEGIWAPEIGKLNDKYYAYYSVSTFGSQQSVIGVAVNETLDPANDNYQWQDLGLVIESFPGYRYNAIDAAPFQDDDGSAYIVWGSYWEGLFLSELDPETGKRPEGAEEIHVAARPGVGSRAIEAPYMTKRGDYYYLWVSWDWCCGGAESTYKVVIGRSRNPKGPFRDYNGRTMTRGGGTLVVANNDNWRGTAHNSVVKTDMGDWIAHHTYDTCNLHKHRIEQVRPIYWSEDGWPVVGEPVSDNNPMHTGPVEIDSGNIPGSWRISIDYEEDRIIDLIDGGTVAFAPETTWTVRGNQIMISSPEEVYICHIEPSQRSFIGRDQDGQVIRGIKICSK